MASGMGVPGRASSQNRAAGVPAAAGWPYTAEAVPVVTKITRKSANGYMTQVDRLDNYMVTSEIVWRDCKAKAYLALHPV